MSKAIMVKDETYYMIKAYALKRDDSLSGTVEQAVRFSIETDKAQGGNLGNSPELLALYNKMFVEKPVSELELFKKKVLDYVGECEDTKGKITNFVSSL